VFRLFAVRLDSVGPGSDQLWFLHERTGLLQVWVRNVHLRPRSFRLMYVRSRRDWGWQFSFAKVVFPCGKRTKRIRSRPSGQHLLMFGSLVPRVFDVDPLDEEMREQYFSLFGGNFRLIANRLRFRANRQRSVGAHGGAFGLECEHIWPGAFWEQRESRGFRALW
jgi:hypothetical protein